jgi:hypothetical protein
MESPLIAKTEQRHALRALAASTLLVLALTACNADKTAPAPSQGPATIDAAGGTVTGPDGVTLAIPAGAVATGTTFQITRSATGAPRLVGMTLLSALYEVTPHGATFDTPTLLTLPYDPTKAAPGAVPVVLQGEPDGTWHVHALRTGTGSSAAGTALVDVSGLSWFAVGTCTPGNAGTFGFGIGDCPANTELKLEYLDGSGVAHPVSRTAPSGGIALPFLPPITAPTDVLLRVTWTRPAGVNRVDTVALGNSWNSVSTSKQYFTQDVNQTVFTRDTFVHIDPATTQGAGQPNGVHARFGANASYCFTGFIIGIGNTTVCWEFDTDIVFTVHDTSVPSAPTIVQQPATHDVIQSQPVTFTVKATSANTLVVNWQRLSNGTWLPANNAAFPTGGTTVTHQPGGRAPGDSSLTLSTTSLANDDQARFRAQVCSMQASGTQTCVLSDEATLGVVDTHNVNVPPVFTVQPQNATVPNGQTFSVSVTAASRPGPDIAILMDGVDVLDCPNTGGAHASTGPVPTPCTYTGVANTVLSPMHFVATATVPWSSGNYVATSQTATITVGVAASAPVIPAPEPADVTVPTGTPATFTVNATGTAPLTYQWTCGSHLVSGATGSSLTLNPGDADYVNAAQCHVVVSNSAGTTGPSRPATLTLTSATAYHVTTLGGRGPVGGIPLAFWNPFGGIAADAAGNVYVIDSNGAGEWIRRFKPDGTTDIFAGADQTTFSTRALGMTADAAGNLYVTDETVIRKVDPSGNVTVLAGGPYDPLHPYVDVAAGQALSAKFSFLEGIARDAAGNIYVVDVSHSNGFMGVRKLSTDGSVSSLSGASTTTFSLNNGPGAQAQFNLGIGNTEGGLAINSAGLLYLADVGNHVIRSITTVAGANPAGWTSTFSGDPSYMNSCTPAPCTVLKDGIAATAGYPYLGLLAEDGHGNTYVADLDASSGSVNLGVIRKVDSNGNVTTVVGGNPNGPLDGYGRNVQLGPITAITVAPDGTIYAIVADYERLVKIQP